MVDPKRADARRERYGQQLVFNFAEGVDLTKLRRYSPPAFQSEAGWWLTLGTADGKSYSKNIYKTASPRRRAGRRIPRQDMAKALRLRAAGRHQHGRRPDRVRGGRNARDARPYDKGVVVLLDIDLAE
ncbi:MAG: hypothetical protein ACLT1W_13310 [Alistipes onderdonkii]